MMCMYVCVFVTLQGLGKDDVYVCVFVTLQGFRECMCVCYLAGV